MAGFNVDVPAGSSGEHGSPRPVQIAVEDDEEYRLLDKRYPSLRMFHGAGGRSGSSADDDLVVHPLARTVYTNHGTSGGRPFEGMHNNGQGKSPSGSSRVPEVGVGGGGASAPQNEFRITIDDGGRGTDRNREATIGDANELNQPEPRGQMQYTTVDKFIAFVLAVFFAAAGSSWAAYPVLQNALGPKWAPYGFAAAWVPVVVLGAGVLAALALEKSPKSRVFIKGAILLTVVGTVALGIGAFIAMLIFGR